MQLKSYIKVYDNCLPLENISTLIQWANKKQISEKGRVGNDQVNENIRKVKLSSFMDWSSKEKTKIHWCNYLQYIFSKYLHEYSKKIYPHNQKLADNIIQIDLLKYEEGGFYTPHVDHYGNNPRTISFILILNNDYEGGELEFCNPNTGESYKKIKGTPGSLIVWPSNFLYLHKVNSIKKGTRYSIVAWAL
jgi:Rps23 Pro-64 3,4-dihydroxylase Tpa1-like proline 4-hydroxylase